MSTRDDLFVPRGLGDRESAEHAAGGPARDHRDGTVANRRGVGEAAGRVHHAQPGEALVDAVQVTAGGWLEKRVDGGRAGALVFPVLGKGLVGGAHLEARFTQCAGEAGLVFWSQIGEQQADGDCFRAQLACLLDHPRDLRVVEGCHDLAVGADPLPHGDDIAPGDDVRRPARLKVVEGGALLPPDDEQVAEAFGRDEDGAGSTALEEGVRGNGASVRQALVGQAASAGQNGFFGGRRALRGASRCGCLSLRWRRSR